MHELNDEQMHLPDFKIGLHPWYTWRGKRRCTIEIPARYSDAVDPEQARIRDQLIRSVEEYHRFGSLSELQIEHLTDAVRKYLTRVDSEATRRDGLESREMVEAVVNGIIRKILPQISNGPT